MLDKLNKSSEAEVFRSHLDHLVTTDSVQTMNISPIMASVMLDRNTGNRTLSTTRVERYAADMKSKRWKLTGEPIIFSDAGILNDGQTRLAASVRADVSFTSDVRFGIARDAFDVTGCGAKRTLADVFSIKKEENPTRLAGALNWMNGYERGFSSPKLSHVDGMQMLEKHPEIRKSVIPGAHLYAKTKFMEPSLAIFLHYIFALQDLDKADAFFEFLTEGVGATGKRDPRHVIRERLISNKGDKAKLPPIEIAAIMIKAWNSYRKDNEVNHLRWMTKPMNGASPEAFPRAR